MFGKLFNKTKEKLQPPPVVPPVPPSRFSRAAGSDNFTSVIVPRSAVERAKSADNAYYLVQAIVDFVNAMLTDGLYSRFEMSLKAMQAYHADFYLAQVNNGGHSQFVHNSHDNLAYVIADARAALAGMGAQEHLAILERMTAWAREHPDEVSKQTGFQGGRAPLLDELDTLFYKANEATPMLALSARWISSWPELKIVEDDDYKEVIRRAAIANPLREPRLVHRSVANLSHQMTDWLQVGIGLACASGPRTEVKLAIGNGQMMDIEGEKQTAFYVRTNADQPRFCVVTDNYAAAYEYVAADNPPMPDAWDVEGVKKAIDDGRMGNYKAPSIGRKLSHVRSETMAGIIELANEYRTAAAIDLLLRRAGIDPNGATVSPMSLELKPEGPVANWLLLAGGELLTVLTVPNGSALLRPGDNQHLGTVRSFEIEEHAARAEAGGIVRPS